MLRKLSLKDSQLPYRCLFEVAQRAWRPSPGIRKANMKSNHKVNCGGKGNYDNLSPL